MFSAAIDGAVYARHGTTMDTRLTVIDKRAADDPTAFPASPGLAPDVATLLGWIAERVPSRLPITAPLASPIIVRSVATGASRPVVLRASSIPATAPEPKAIELAYEVIDWKPVEGGNITDALYEEYGLQSIRIPGACPHPTKLVQSAAMASVTPPQTELSPASSRQHRVGRIAVRCPA